MTLSLSHTRAQPRYAHRETKKKISWRWVKVYRAPTVQQNFKSCSVMDLVLDDCVLAIIDITPLDNL